MLKVEKIQSYLNCCLCSKLLNRPVALPCGETICESHLEEMLVRPEENQDQTSDEEKRIIKCLFCEKMHHGEFQIVKVLEKMIQLKMCDIKCTKYSECNGIINELKEDIKKTDAIVNNAEDFIHSYFGKIKEQVHIQRETLKERIDKYYENILGDIAVSEEDCEMVIQSIDEITYKLNDSKREMKQLLDELDSFEISEYSYELLKSKAVELKPKFSKMSQEIKNDILVNCTYNFHPEDMKVEKYFGHFEIVNFNSSHIIDQKQSVELRELCNFDYHQKWRLLYRGSDHEFTAKMFHEKCDGLKQTLTIIKAPGGNIFGGYTDAEFSSNNSYNHDSNAFLFTLVNDSSVKRKITCSQPENAIFTSSDHGPRFGSAPNLSISDRSNHNESSYNLESCFIDSENKDLFVKEKNFFLTEEIEIYRKI